MNNRNVLTAHLQEQGIASGTTHERSVCLNSKTMEIYTCGVAHKTAESRSQIIGLMKNRTEKKSTTGAKAELLFCFDAKLGSKTNF